MTEQNQLDALLLHYEELQAQGTAASPEELCQDCPELVAEVKRRIRILESMDAIWNAGMKDWERFDDPDGYLQEIRGEE